MNVRRLVVVVLLVASTVNLALMVPGGFVETRDFSAYPAFVLAAFNALLTVLGLGSLVLAVAVARKGRGHGLSALAGLVFAGVYLLDLGAVFPVTPSPMSALLSALEWLGVGLGVALAVASIGPARSASMRAVDGRAASLPWPLGAALALLALAIVVFATRAAMGG
ncbi:hypothetical protein [Marilutibacter maris]|uniref:DUF8051 domain-containing protein n=1 Tax=Marilutibacter maris TaxID=1605891 RepID=A0A2U9T670_9GAMM|nr:hypothetical protein [Lysobacter maris]AWV08033.1 hypothetical protein C9I47_2354 [Lysobacter maris]